MAERSDERNLRDEQNQLGKERMLALTEPLLAWYAANARQLPWRESPDAYRVWISEIMLQQTRVEAVKPYYEKFLLACPHPAALAVMEEDSLMKLWEGLGYYSRARNLKKAAAVLCEKFGGELPKSYEELLTLPGIGSYTAGAIASIAYGIAVPAVDGNVLRVLSRVLLRDADVSKPETKREAERLLRAVMPTDRAGAYNQALMELGAMVCIPNGAPRCDVCPLASLCLACQKKVQSEFPVKTAKKARRQEERTVLLLRDAKGLLLHKRAKKGLLSGLYELPNFLGHLTEEELLSEIGLDRKGANVTALPAAKHIFSHLEWQLAGYLVWVEDMQQTLLFLGGEKKQYFCVSKEELESRYGLPSAFLAYREWMQ
ncbi:MAG: A/G-specific adenine glycosylase [bacterium]|nr:A/G-specific adenine glycosylase [bacterium]